MLPASSPSEPGSPSLAFTHNEVVKRKSDFFKEWRFPLFNSKKLILNSKCKKIYFKKRSSYKGVGGIDFP